MSTKYVYICDHCGAECGAKFEFSLFGEWARKDAQGIPDNVHGCSREHTILAVAKILGVGVDGKASELLAAKDREIERQHGVIRSQNNDIARMQERIAVLESRPDTAEVLRRVLSQYEGKAMSAAENELLQDIVRQFASLTGPKKPTKPVAGSESLRPFLERIGFVMKEWQAKSSDHDKHSIDVRNAYSECVDALEKELRNEDPKWCHACLNTGHNPLFLHNNCQYCAWKRRTQPAVDHAHELGSCTFCDTKPQSCADCGGTGLLLSGQQCTDCRGKGYL